METFDDDLSQEELNALDAILGDALRDDGSIDFAVLDARCEIIDLDEWERSFLNSIDT